MLTHFLEIFSFEFQYESTLDSVVVCVLRRVYVLISETEYSIRGRVLADERSLAQKELPTRFIDCAQS